MVSFDAVSGDAISGLVFNDYFYDADAAGSGIITFSGEATALLKHDRGGKGARKRGRSPLIYRYDVWKHQQTPISFSGRTTAEYQRADRYTFIKSLNVPEPIPFGLFKTFSPKINEGIEHQRPLPSEDLPFWKNLRRNVYSYTANNRQPRIFSYESGGPNPSAFTYTSQAVIGISESTEIDFDESQERIEEEYKKFLESQTSTYEYQSVCKFYLFVKTKAKYYDRLAYINKLDEDFLLLFDSPFEVVE